MSDCSTRLQSLRLAGPNGYVASRMEHRKAYHVEQAASPLVHYFSDPEQLQTKETRPDYETLHPRQ